MNAKPRQRGQGGSSLIETLVAIIVSAFGLLGFVGLQTRSTSAEFEAYQRSQALVLLEDMTNRINANRANAGAYVSQQPIGGGALADCGGLSDAALDLCEWANLLRGSAEARNGRQIGSMISARGCITRHAGTTDRYAVSVVWQGIVPTGAPGSDCGEGDPVFPSQALRRAVSSTICVARLRDLPSAPPTPRC